MPPHPGIAAAWAGGLLVSPARPGAGGVRDDRSGLARGVPSGPAIDASPGRDRPRSAAAPRSGRVTEAGERRLLVRVGGEIWTAESPDALREGEAVRVVGVEGLTLRVKYLAREGSDGFGGRLET